MPIRLLHRLTTLDRAAARSLRRRLIAATRLAVAPVAVGTLIVQLTTLLRWHRELFRGHWRRKSRATAPAHRPPLAPETVTLIREMAVAKGPSGNNVADNGGLVVGWAVWMDTSASRRGMAAWQGCWTSGVGARWRRPRRWRSAGAASRRWHARPDWRAG